MELSNKIALVTGAGDTGGIGFQIAAALLREGARVVISGRAEARGLAAAAALGKDARFVTADLSDLDSVRSLADQAGPIDILINNAAVSNASHTAQTQPDSFDEVFATNVRGPFFLTAALIPHMIARGGGSIVNLSTLLARHGNPGMPAYGASKAAIESLTRSWAAEFAPSGIRVNAVAPGATGSEKVKGALGENLDALVHTIPLARIGSTQDVAEAVLFLASDRASYITGAVIPVDGGRAAV